MWLKSASSNTSYIGLMETYKNIPKLSTIERIAEALDVPVLELFAPSENAAANPTETEPSALSKNVAKETERRQKSRDHIKTEILTKLSSNLDDVLQMI